METNQPSTLNPWLSIWIKPRQTIRQIIDGNPERYVALLAILGGIYRALNQSSKRGLGDDYDLVSIILYCIITGFFYGFLLWVIFAELFRWIGSWLGGQAKSREIKAALGWSSIPAVVLFLIYIPLIVIFRRNWFVSSSIWMSQEVFYFSIFVLGPIGLILQVWQYILTIFCVAEAHRFSNWRGLVTVILGTLVIVVPVVLLETL